MKVPAPHNRVKMNVACQSSRFGTPDLIVLHSTEGFTGPNGLKDMGHFFDNPTTKASAHRGVSRIGGLAQYVPDSRKAWACVGYNSASLNVEIIGFAASGRAAWWRYPLQLRRVAFLVAYWADKYGIPLQKGAVSNGIVKRPGVIRHMDLGAVGGGHDDPGPAFPEDWIIRKAQAYQRKYHKRKR